MKSPNLVWNWQNLAVRRTLTEALDGLFQTKPVLGGERSTMNGFDNVKLVKPARLVTWNRWPVLKVSFKTTTTTTPILAPFFFFFWTGWDAANACDVGRANSPCCWKGRNCFKSNIDETWKIARRYHELYAVRWDTLSIWTDLTGAVLIILSGCYISLNLCRKGIVLILD